MTPRLLPNWDRLQLAFLRSLVTVLAILDDLLHVNWGERLLQRLADRWKVRLEELDHSLAHLEAERQRLHRQAEALALYAAVVYLGSRCLARQELRFDPADPHDEQMLDASIDLLVKDKLAALEPVEIGPGRYVYSLEPDWAAIRARLTGAASRAEPEFAGCFQEALDLIDEAFLSETVT